MKFVKKLNLKVILIEKREKRTRMNVRGIVYKMERPKLMRFLIKVWLINIRLLGIE